MPRLQCGKQVPEYTVARSQDLECLHRQLCETGSFLASPSDSSCAKKNERIAVEKNILDMMIDQPSTNTLIISKHLHALQSLIWRILKDKRLHPFKIQRLQALIQQDYPRRMEFSSWFL